MITVPYAYHTQALRRWLKLMRVNVPSETIDLKLENHPEWPSLLCVSDALYNWKIPHSAAKEEHKVPDDIPVPFLAVTQHPERPFAIVTGVEKETISLYQNNYKKIQQVNREVFIKSWTGVFMLAEPTEESGVKVEQNIFKNGLKYKWLVGFTIAALLCVLGFMFLPHLVTTSNSAETIGKVFLFILYTAGLGISNLLLWHEIDQSNPLLQKVCTGIAKTNCNAILNSKASKIFSWLSWSESGFFYFAGGLLLLAMPGYAPWAVQWLSLLGLLSITYPVYSIYYQWKVAAQWCVLCLAVQAVLILSFGVILSMLLPISVSFLQLSVLLPLAIAYGLPILIWYTIKPVLNRLYIAKQERRSYLRLKFNPEVFTTLLQKQKAILTSTHELGIELGNPMAPNTLVKVCNPYCGPCIQAHPKIENLLNKNENLKVQILFMTPDMPEDRIHKTVSHILAMSKKVKTKPEMQQVLDDWYLPEKKEYEAFAAKYPLNGEIRKEAANVSAMTKWCLENNISYTPTIFFNGYELPKEFDLEDIQYFLQE